MPIVSKSQVAGNSDNDIFLIFVDLHNKNKKKYSLNCLSGTLKSIYEAKKGVFSIKAYNYNSTKCTKVSTHTTYTTYTTNAKGAHNNAKGVYSIC